MNAPLCTLGADELRDELLAACDKAQAAIADGDDETRRGVLLLAINLNPPEWVKVAFQRARDCRPARAGTLLDMVRADLLKPLANSAPGC